MDSERLFKEVVRIVSRWSPKGEKLLSNGVRLICPTPQVAPEAWLHVLFPPLELCEIEKMERDLGKTLPDDFIQFLKLTNGIELFSYRISLFGLRKDLSRTGDEAWQPFDLPSHNTSAARPDGSPDDVVYFAAIDGGVNWCFFEFEASGYRVGKTDRHNFQPTVYSGNFASWLLDEVGSLDLLFDDDGVMIATGVRERIM